MICNNGAVRKGCPDALSPGAERTKIAVRREARVPELTCRSCAHFVDDPEQIEAQLPGINILSSAYGSVRGDAGICRKKDLFMEPVLARDCRFFEKAKQTS